MSSVSQERFPPNPSANMTVSNNHEVYLRSGSRQTLAYAANQGYAFKCISGAVPAKP